MAHEFFKKFNEGQRRNYENEAGIELPPIEDLPNDRSAFEKKQSPETVELAEGLTLEKGNLELDETGNFVNYFDLSLTTGSKNISVDLFSRNNPIHLKRLLQNDPTIIAATNGGLFFLADESPDQLITNANLQLDIRNGKIHSLPVADRPFLCLEEGTLEVKDVLAFGEIKINNNTYTWKGSSSLGHPGEAVLYTAASGIISHKPSKETGSIRVVEPVTTPIDANMMDVVLSIDNEKGLFVKEIKAGGGSSVYQELGILQFPHHVLINPGEQIEMTALGNLDIKNISAGFSIGPAVSHFLNNVYHEINSDRSLGDNSPYGENRMARIVIYKDKSDSLHIRLFDGVPKSDICRGISTQEVAQLFTGIDTKWAYHLDGGQSAKIVTKEINSSNASEDSIRSYGNHHYLRWPKKPDHPYIWDPRVGRKTPNGMIFRVDLSATE